MILPQLVDDQTFVATKIVLASRRQEMADDFREHTSTGFRTIEIQSSVGMCPSWCWINSTAMSQYDVGVLIPALPGLTLFRCAKIALRP